MILITGASGLLGGRLCNYFTEQKFSIVAGLRQINNQDLICQEKRIFDLEKHSSFKSATQKIDTVLHLAGMNSQESEANKTKSLRNVSTSLIKFLDVCKINGVKRFIYFSSAQVYGFDNGGIFSENSVTNPSSIYAKNHLIAEQNLIDFCKENNIHWNIFRLSNIFGAPLNKEVNCWNLFVQNLARSAAESNLLEIHSNKYSTRDFLSIDTFCEVLINFLELNSKVSRNRTFNLSSGKTLPLWYVAELLKQHTEKLLNAPVRLNFQNHTDQNNDFIIDNKVLKEIIAYEDNIENEIINLVSKSIAWFSN